MQKYHPDYTNLLGVPDGSGALDNPATPQIEGRKLYNTDWQDLIYRTSFLVTITLVQEQTYLVKFRLELLLVMLKMKVL